MWYIVIFIIIVYIVNIYTNKKRKIRKENIIKENNNNLSKYTTNNYLMTQTELQFYRELKKVTDKLEFTIFPQVNLERIVNVIDNNIADRNKIKSRSIDYTIVNNKNCKIVCCIELDDYTHNRKKVIENDNFKNELFKKVDIPLYRIKVNKYYNLEELEHIIKESYKPPISIVNNS